MFCLETPNVPKTKKCLDTVLKGIEKTVAEPYFSYTIFEDITDVSFRITYFGIEDEPYTTEIVPFGINKKYNYKKMHYYYEFRFSEDQNVNSVRYQLQRCLEEVDSFLADIRNDEKKFESWQLYDWKCQNLIAFISTHGAGGPYD